MYMAAFQTKFGSLPSNVRYRIHSDAALDPAEAAAFKVERARLLSVADAAPRREYYRHHVELVRAQSHFVTQKPIGLSS